jgi:hypothetical protein
MAILIMAHTHEKERFEVEVYTQVTSTTHPVIGISYGAGQDTEDITIFPNFEQVKQMHKALENYIKKCEESGTFKEELANNEEI